ncbi:MAG TPA: hypothetical protein VF076_02620 [Acidimicrobiales bacterium]
MGSDVQVRTSFRFRRRSRATVEPALDACSRADPGLVLDTYARHWRHLVEGATERIDDHRSVGPVTVARALAGRGALANGLTEDTARDVIFTLMSPAVHRTLTVQRGWPPDRYERWLARALRALLLPHEVEPAPRRRRG